MWNVPVTSLTEKVRFVSEPPKYLLAPPTASTAPSAQRSPTSIENRRSSLTAEKASSRWRRKRVSKTSNDIPERANKRLSLHHLGTTNGGDAKSNSEQTKLHLKSYNIGSKRQIIPHFRKQLWKTLDGERDKLNLDLFWPTRMEVAVNIAASHGEATEQADEIQDEVFPLEDLQPLSQFRSLRYLQLNGMLQSYQKYIWPAVWLNPELEHLTLEMALAPSISDVYTDRIKEIGKGWTMRDHGPAHYLGDEEGNLLYSVGDGEYLDQRSMKKAWNAARSLGCTLRFLPVVRLELAGFVVDAGPFQSWFSSVRLREIVFKHDCFDGGFSLPRSMRGHVSISTPNALHSICQGQRAEMLEFKKAVKVVEIRLHPKNFAPFHNSRSVSPPPARRATTTEQSRDKSPHQGSSSEKQYLVSGALPSQNPSSSGNSDRGHKATRRSLLKGKKDKEKDGRKKSDSKRAS